MNLENLSYSLLIWKASSRVWHITSTDTYQRSKCLFGEIIQEGTFTQCFRSRLTKSSPDPGISLNPVPARIQAVAESGSDPDPDQKVVYIWRKKKYKRKLSSFQSRPILWNSYLQKTLTSLQENPPAQQKKLCKHNFSASGIGCLFDPWIRDG